MNNAQNRFDSSAHSPINVGGAGNKNGFLRIKVVRCSFQAPSLMGDCQNQHCRLRLFVNGNEKCANLTPTSCTITTSHGSMALSNNDEGICSMVDIALCGKNVNHVLNHLCRVIKEFRILVVLLKSLKEEDEVLIGGSKLYFDQEDYFSSPLINSCEGNTANFERREVLPIFNTSGVSVGKVSLEVTITWEGRKGDVFLPDDYNKNISKNTVQPVSSIFNEFSMDISAHDTSIARFEMMEAIVKADDLTQELPLWPSNARLTKEKIEIEQRDHKNSFASILSEEQNHSYSLKNCAPSTPPPRSSVNPRDRLDVTNDVKLVQNFLGDSLKFDDKMHDFIARNHPSNDIFINNAHTTDLSAIDSLCPPNLVDTEISFLTIESNFSVATVKSPHHDNLSRRENENDFPSMVLHDKNRYEMLGKVRSFKLEVRNIVFMDVFKTRGPLRISYNLPPFTKNSSRDFEQSFITNETSNKQSRTSKSSTRVKSCLSRDTKYQYEAKHTNIYNISFEKDHHVLSWLESKIKFKVFSQRERDNHGIDIGEFSGQSPDDCPLRVNNKKAIAKKQSEQLIGFSETHLSKALFSSDLKYEDILPIKGNVEKGGSSIGTLHIILSLLSNEVVSTERNNDLENCKNKFAENKKVMKKEPTAFVKLNVNAATIKSKLHGNSDVTKSSATVDAEKVKHFKTPRKAKQSRENVKSNRRRKDRNKGHELKLFVALNSFDDMAKQNFPRSSINIFCAGEDLKSYFLVRDEIENHSFQSSLDFGKDIRWSPCLVLKTLKTRLLTPSERLELCKLTIVIEIKEFQSSAKAKIQNNVESVKGLSYVSLVKVAEELRSPNSGLRNAPYVVRDDWVDIISPGGSDCLGKVFVTVALGLPRQIELLDSIKIATNTLQNWWRIILEEKIAAESLVVNNLDIFDDSGNEEVICSTTKNLHVEDHRFSQPNEVCTALGRSLVFEMRPTNNCLIDCNQHSTDGCYIVYQFPSMLLVDENTKSTQLWWDAEASIMHGIAKHEFLIPNTVPSLSYIREIFYSVEKFVFYVNEVNSIPIKRLAHASICSRKLLQKLLEDPPDSPRNCPNYRNIHVRLSLEKEESIGWLPSYINLNIKMKVEPKSLAIARQRRQIAENLAKGSVPSPEGFVVSAQKEVSNAVRARKANLRLQVPHITDWQGVLKLHSFFSSQKRPKSAALLISVNSNTKEAQELHLSKPLTIEEITEESLFELSGLFVFDEENYCQLLFTLWFLPCMMQLKQRSMSFTEMSSLGICIGEIVAPVTDFLKGIQSEFKKVCYWSCQGKNDTTDLPVSIIFSKTLGECNDDAEETNISKSLCMSHDLQFKNLAFKSPDWAGYPYSIHADIKTETICEREPNVSQETLSSSLILETCSLSSKINSNASDSFLTTSSDSSAIELLQSPTRQANNHKIVSSRFTHIKTDTANQVDIDYIQKRHSHSPAKVGKKLQRFNLRQSRYSYPGATQKNYDREDMLCLVKEQRFKRREEIKKLSHREKFFIPVESQSHSSIDSNKIDNDTSQELDILCLDGESTCPNERISLPLQGKAVGEQGTASSCDQSMDSSSKVASSQVQSEWKTSENGIVSSLCIPKPTDSFVPDVIDDKQNLEPIHRNSFALPNDIDCFQNTRNTELQRGIFSESDSSTGSLIHRKISETDRIAHIMEVFLQSDSEGNSYDT